MRSSLIKLPTAKRLITLLLFAVMACSAATVNAGVVVAPVSVSSPQGDYGGSYPLSNAITSSSGLSQTYTDGVTDFDTLVSTATYNGFGGATNTFTGFPQYYLFDLGSARGITAIGLWASRIPGDGSPTSFSLYAGPTIFSGLLGTFISTGGQANAPGQAFNFTATTTQFVLFEVLTTDAPLNYSPTIGQVVFESVPEPSTIALFAMALLSLFGFGLMRRRAEA